MVEVKCIKLEHGASLKLPTYATEGSVGLDLRSAGSNKIVVAPMQRILVPTGLVIELPKGYEAQVRPRSGLAIKSGITVLNSPGTIDSDYRGEIKVILINLGDKDFEINYGDKIAQLILSKVEQAVLIEVNNVSVTARNRNGFGSTGV